MVQIRSSVGNIKRKLLKSRRVPKNGVKNRIFSYSDWIKQWETGLWSDIVTDQDIKISIIVPAFNTPDKYLTPLVDSILNQTYENWELCLVDASSIKERSAKIKSVSEIDKRIVYIRASENKGIAANTNIGIRNASGSYIAFTDHDDTLATQALNEVVRVIHSENADLIYSDEDKLSDDGKVRQNPFFKPGWSQDLIYSVNYLAHFVVVSRKVVDKINGLREGFDGAQDYDFILRVTEVTSKIKHIDKMLYHWRLADGSTAIDVTAKNYADDAGQKALKDAIRRRKIDAKAVGVIDHPTNYRVKYELPKQLPKVSIIIPFKDKPDLLRQCVDSIVDKSEYANYELILVSNNSVEPEIFELLKEYKKLKICKVFEWNKPFNYSAINNFASKQADGEYLIMLNNDTKVITSDWIEELIGVASQEEVGAVGPMLFYENKTIQHAGVILGMGSMAGHVFRHRLKGEWTDFGLTSWPRTYLAVTGACLAIKKAKFLEVSGFDEEFTVAGNDVALGISLYEKGYRNVFWPFAELIHFENASVGSYNNVPSKDYDHSLTYYKKYLNYQDPFFNSNLDLMDEYVGIRSSYED